MLLPLALLLSGILSPVFLTPHIFSPLYRAVKLIFFLIPQHLAPNPQVVAVNSGFVLPDLVSLINCNPV